jgi:ABC-type Co2+ transport system permease subunit
MLFYTSLTPIHIWLLYSIFLKPAQEHRTFIAVATKANIALLTTATQVAFTYITTKMRVY